MSFSNVELVRGPVLLSAGENRLPTKPSAITITKRARPHLQVRSEGKQESGPPKAFSISRRDIMLCLPTAATLAAVTFSSVEPAEARVVKPEIRRKIFEKLEMLREKAGLSTPKTEGGAYPSPPKSENKAPSPLPSPQGIQGVPTVEAILP